MNCLCCGKPIIETAGEVEKTTSWHNACVKKFFGTLKLPDMDISKPQTTEYRALPEAEYLVMEMAKATGIKTVPFALIKMQSGVSHFAYITKRIDRIFPKETGKRVQIPEEGKVQMLAMEDFCQLEGRLTTDKYRGSYERCAKVIVKYSVQPLFDLTELFLRVVFSFVAGNSDMHLKNFSLIENAYQSGAYILAAAYDLLPVNVVLPEDQDQFALTMNGKKRNLRRNDFFIFAENIGIPSKSADKLLKKVISMEDQYIKMCRESFLPDSMKIALEELLTGRLQILK